MLGFAEQWKQEPGWCHEQPEGYRGIPHMNPSSPWPWEHREATVALALSILWWSPGAVLGPGAQPGAVLQAGERLVHSQIYLMNRLCSLCCFLICISSSCQPRRESHLSFCGEKKNTK